MCVCVCVYLYIDTQFVSIYIHTHTRILEWTNIYLHDEVTKWSSLDGGIINECLFLYALLYFKISCSMHVLVL